MILGLLVDIWSLSWVSSVSTRSCRDEHEDRHV